MIPVEVCRVSFPVVKAETLTGFGPLETGKRIPEILRIIIQIVGFELGRAAREREAKYFGSMIQAVEKHSDDNCRRAFTEDRRLLAPTTRKICSYYEITVPSDAGYISSGGFDLGVLAICYLRKKQQRQTCDDWAFHRPRAGPSDRTTVALVMPGRI
jgi:hypothetical protein